MKYSKREQQEAKNRLAQWVKPGDTIYTILRHRSASGMSRVVDLKKIEGSEVSSLAYNVAIALGWSYDRDREGLKVGGCGMDVGFEAIYNKIPGICLPLKG